MKKRKPLHYVFNKIDLTTHEHLKYWLVKLPQYGDKGWYTTIRSLNAFCHGLKQRCYDSKDKAEYKRSGFLYHGKLLEEYELDRKNWLDTCRRLKIDKKGIRPSVKSMEVIDGLWNFYKAIGYDHKRNKYTSNIGL